MQGSSPSWPTYILQSGDTADVFSLWGGLCFHMCLGYESSLQRSCKAEGLWWGLGLFRQCRLVPASKVIVFFSVLGDSFYFVLRFFLKWNRKVPEVWKFFTHWELLSYREDKKYQSLKWGIWDLSCFPGGVCIVAWAMIPRGTHYRGVSRVSRRRLALSFMKKTAPGQQYQGGEIFFCSHYKQNHMKYKPVQIIQIINVIYQIKYQNIIWQKT